MNDWDNRSTIGQFLYYYGDCRNCSVSVERLSQSLGVLDLFLSLSPERSFIIPRTFRNAMNDWDNRSTMGQIGNYCGLGKLRLHISLL